MSRPNIRYVDGAPIGKPVVGFDPDIPMPGHYRMRLRSGGAFVGVRIWFGAPLDPVTGEEMDRSHRLQAAINGQYAEIERVWPRCAREPVTAAEYDHLCRVQSWAEQNAPDSALADPRRKLDPLNSPLLF